MTFYFSENVSIFLSGAVSDINLKLESLIILIKGKLKVEDLLAYLFIIIFHELHIVVEIPVFGSLAHGSP